MCENCKCEGANSGGPIVLKCTRQNLDVKIVNKSKHELPSYATLGSAGMDLRADIDEEVILKPGQRKLIPTNLFIQLPIGYEAQIRPRSGLAYKHGVTVLNSPGTIDCVAKGTKIKTLDSEILVEDLFESNSKKNILSFNEDTMKLEEDRVSDMWIVDNLELLEIEVEDNTLKIPKNKPVYTKRGWIKACDLNLYDEVLNIL